MPSFKAIARFIHKAAHSGYNYSKSTNLLQIGAASGVDNPFLTPAQSKKVDKKLDDGSSKTGKMSYRVLGSTTDATCSGGGADYGVSSKAIGCNIVLELGSL